MRQKLQQFMYGRYGFDDLSKIYLLLTIVCIVASMFTRKSFFYLLGIALLIYTYYRAFSRQTAKRQMENQKFLNLRYQAKVRQNKRKVRREQKKIYRFYKCPSCKQTVRVPKGRGKICITCPKCNMEFIKKS
ncbi:MAG: hypothetical protein NC307_03595 [Roseburia sp.]|nr:hypothetical protein [Roseburia sp.]